MANKISLRCDIGPTQQQITDAAKPVTVTIFAPEWVQQALAQLQPSLVNKLFQVYKNKTGKPEVFQEFQISEVITLKQLQLMARNEKSNTSGWIDWDSYEGIDPEVVLSLKDLTRQCILIGRDRTTHYGGYRANLVAQQSDVYVIDLAGLQFQHADNSGRLVLYKEFLPSGKLDDFIFQNVVGEPRKTFTEVKQIVENKENPSSRYIETGRSGSSEYFDILAYQRFVANDVILTGKAVCSFATEHVNFKFLKYGTGFFAAGCTKILNENILSGVLLGIEAVLREDTKKVIKSLEFPLYDPPVDSDSRRKLDSLGIPYTFSNDDALKGHGSLINAVTNCADPHVALGNEMGYKSVDAAIAENLRFKGVQFSPAINTMMNEKFVQISKP